MKNGIMEVLENEELGWKKIREMRKKFSPDLVSEVAVSSHEDALDRANTVINAVMKAAAEVGIDIMATEPGHGPGHMLRDKVNALRVISQLDEIEPKQVFIGLIAGVLHDLGCTVTERYDDSKKAVRHAEAGAILLGMLCEYAPGIVSESESILIQYAIAAHTHYAKEQDVTCADGVTRTVQPYQDMVGENPFYPNWLPRWIDRLDINGPCFPGRHFLTLADPHVDYSASGFYEVNFGSHLVPLLREKPEGPRTMVEHFKMFADSQTNGSPYGKYDFGAMVELRDKERKQLYRIIQATQTGVILPQSEEDKILSVWEVFLGTNIEPSDKGKAVASVLMRNFRKLPKETRSAWANAFRVTMEEYLIWAEEAMAFLDNCPASWLAITGITDDVRSIIRPMRNG